MNFKIARAYGNIKNIVCEDLLEAVQYTFNIEGDLFYNGKLLVSVMGYTHEQNIENLSKEGIVMYFPDGCVEFKWADDSKNIPRYFAHVIDLKELQMGKKAEIHVHEYRSLSEEIKFDSLDAIREYAQQRFSYPTKDILISFYSSKEGHRYL